MSRRLRHLLVDMGLVVMVVVTAASVTE